MTPDERMGWQKLTGEVELMLKIAAEREVCARVVDPRPDDCLCAGWSDGLHAGGCPVGALQERAAAIRARGVAEKPEATA